METNLRTKTFIVPSGRSVTIREQNGADDDILSNSFDARTLMNLSKFISAIVVDTNFEGSIGRLTPDQVHKMPSLDRYCIMIQSRKFSLGEEFEFSFAWPTSDGREEIVHYSQDLNEFLLNYEHPESITEEELAEKPEAIPMYPMGGTIKDLPITTTSGKSLLFDLLNAEGESFVANMPIEKQTKNASLIARNLRLDVDGKFEKVSHFQMFSVKDMYEIRKAVLSVDPLFYGLTTITNPTTQGTTKVSIMSMEGFFYLGEE